MRIRVDIADAPDMTLDEVCDLFHSLGTVKFEVETFDQNGNIIEWATITQGRVSA